MSWPVLVRPGHCRTPIELHVYGEGVDGDGAPEEVFAAALTCNWQDGGGVVMTGERAYTRLSGRALFPGDICPEVPVIADGYGVVFGTRRRIVRGSKARNPDGTVSYTEVTFA